MLESWNFQIHHATKVVLWVKQGLGSFNKVVVVDCLQQLVYPRKKLHNLGASLTTNILETRSISHKPQTSAKRRTMLDISQELIGSSLNTNLEDYDEVQMG